MYASAELVHHNVHQRHVKKGACHGGETGNSTALRAIAHAVRPPRSWQAQRGRPISTSSHASCHGGQAGAGATNAAPARLLVLQAGKHTCRKCLSTAGCVWHGMACVDTRCETAAEASVAVRVTVRTCMCMMQ